MCAVAMRFERAHLFLHPSAGGGAVAHQPSQPIDFDFTTSGSSEDSKKEKRKGLQVRHEIPISRILSGLDDRTRTNDD
jgi:hypothetical protein